MSAGGSAMEAMFTRGVEPLPLDAVATLAREAYGLDCSAIERLAGERDQNYRVEARGGRAFVLKIAHPSEPREVTALQTLAFKHMALADPDLPVQRLVPTRLGEDFTVIALDARHSAIVRLFTYLQGRPLQQGPTSAAFRRELGETHARIGLALRDLRHPAEEHDLLWDLQRMDRIRELLPHVESGERRALAARFLDRLEPHGPALGSLRRQLIHNDLNPYNILVGDDGRISGILDFGDLVRAPLLNDVAVAASYLMPCEAGHPLLGVCDYLAAYHRRAPLHGEEIELLFPLITARLVMTLVITEWRARLHPANRAYILRNNARAWAGLRQAAELDADEAQRCLGDACSMQLASGAAR